LASAQTPTQDRANRTAHNPHGAISNVGPDSSNQEKVQELTHRVQLLELQTAQRTGKSDYTVAIIGATAVLGAAIVAALLGICGQVLAARHAAKRDEALYKDAEKILEFRMRQIHQFYAPMFALLRQSKDLYDKMLEQLVEDEPTRYRKAPKAEGRDFRWEVLDKRDAWQGFRLLDQFPAIKSDTKALALADQILVIGERICKIISSRAGYASEALVDMLGQYMAHYAILSTIRQDSRTEAFEPGWHKVGYYPFGLDTQIAQEYHEISKSIDEYRKASTRTLESLAK
jgi:hypothetical protein